MNSTMDKLITILPVSKMSFVNVRGSHVGKGKGGKDWVRQGWPLVEWTETKNKKYANSVELTRL